MSESTMQGRGRATRSFMRAPIKSRMPIDAARRGAANSASRRDNHSQYRPSKTPGAQSNPALERARAIQSRIADCPARPLMARNNASSAFMAATIRRHPSFVNGIPVSSIWLVWLVGVFDRLVGLIVLPRSEMDAHGQLAVDGIIALHLRIERPLVQGRDA